MHNFKFVFLISVHQLLWLITAGAYELLKAAKQSSSVGQYTENTVYRGIEINAASFFANTKIP